ncbi:unnamed protein product [Paramecium primaurelia]|uniref:Transmembrane protein n=1 Tax=Paramecium primaurelia TaxID=5886 RepID=A0A8S1PMU6_PARPR|nr:unnamed protein product [Paramecium primaurelia]
MNYHSIIIVLLYIMLSNLALILYENSFQNKKILIQVAVPDLCISQLYPLLQYQLFMMLVKYQLLKKSIQLAGLFQFSSYFLYLQLVFLLKQFYEDMKERYQSIKEYLKKKKEQVQG